MLPILIVCDLNYHIAINPDEHITVRAAAAHRLSGAEQQKLQNSLLDRLPGRMDREAADAAYLLGEIGNIEAACKLQHILASPLNAPGKFNTTLDRSIERIQLRTYLKKLPDE